MDRIRALFRPGRYLVVLTLGLAACVTTPVVPPTASAPKVQPGYPVEVSPRALEGHVRALTGIAPPRNAANVESLDRAAAYIADRFAEMGYPVYEQRFDAGGLPYKNVLVRYGAESGPRFVIGAHYDVAGSGPGADDNASGVAGLLELARLVAHHRPKLPYAIEFVAYSLEEPPHFNKPTMGSNIHASALKRQGVPVRGMISLEMLGFFSDQPGSQKTPSLLTRAPIPSAGNFIAVVGRSTDAALTARVAEAMRMGSRVGVEALSAPRLVGAGLSDQLNYWNQGWTAVMVTDTSFYRNPHYPKATDTPETLDYARMAEVVRGLYYAVLNL